MSRPNRFNCRRNRWQLRRLPAPLTSIRRLATRFLPPKTAATWSARRRRRRPRPSPRQRRHRGLAKLVRRGKRSQGRLPIPWVRRWLSLRAASHPIRCNSIRTTSTVIPWWITATICSKRRLQLAAAISTWRPPCTRPTAATKCNSTITGRMEWRKRPPEAPATTRVAISTILTTRRTTWRPIPAAPLLSDTTPTSPKVKIFSKSD